MKRFRYMLANWISGGELALEQKRWEMSCGREFQLADANARALELIERMEITIKDREAAMRDLIWAKQAREAALTDIIACDTPNSNGTVKRMVRIAREGLE